VPRNPTSVQARVDRTPGMGENLVSARQQQFDEIPAVLASTASDQCALSHLDLNMPCRSSLNGHHDPFQAPNAAFGGSGSSGTLQNGAANGAAGTAIYKAVGSETPS
jgi:hypothetical protein